VFICTGFPLSGFLGKTSREDPQNLKDLRHCANWQLNDSGTVPTGNLTTQALCQLAT